MSDFEGKIRFKLVLGKYPIIKINKVLLGFDMVLQLPGVTMVVTVPSICDIREGDLLTLYTEVLANASPTHNSDRSTN